MESTSKSTRSTRDARMARVIAAARELFARQGFHATGVAQLCALCEIAPQQLYRDFNDKEAIVEAIVQADIAELFQKVESARSNAQNGPESWDAWLSSVFAPLLEDRDRSLFLEIQAEASRNGRIAEIVRSSDRKIRASLINVLDQLCREHVTDSSKEAFCEIIMLVIFGLPGRRVAHPEMNAHILTSLIRRYLGHELHESPTGLARRE